MLILKTGTKSAYSDGLEWVPVGIPLQGEQGNPACLDT